MGSIDVRTTFEEATDFFTKERKVDSHKGDYGRVYIIAGSPGMTGAASLCAKAALRAGAGLVYIITKSVSMPVYEVLVPEAVKTPITGNQEGHFIPDDVDEIMEKIVSPSCVVIGPGLGNNPETCRFVRRFVKKYKTDGAFDAPMLLDADALNSYTGKTQKLAADMPENGIITPHVMEASRVSGADVEYINNNREEFTRSLAGMLKATVVLKGNKTLIGNHDILCENTSGNPGMATAGSGDVLSGIIAGFIATDYGKVNLFDCVRYAVYIHGHCGDIAARKYGQRFVTATCLTDMLGEIKNGKK